MTVTGAAPQAKISDAAAAAAARCAARSEAPASGQEQALWTAASHVAQTLAMGSWPDGAAQAAGISLAAMAIDATRDVSSEARHVARRVADAALHVESARAADSDVDAAEHLAAATVRLRSARMA